MPKKSKICNKCRIEKLMKFFHKNKYNVDGHSGRCKPCTSEGKKMLRERKIKEAGLRRFHALEGDLPTINFREAITPKGKLKHFTAIFSAISRSGKSTLITWMLNKVKDLYDMVILISQNATADIYDEPIWDFKIRKNHKKLIKQIRMFQRRTHNKLNILFVFDDFTSPQIKSDSSLTNLFVNGRNANLSVIFAAQDHVMINKTIRLNSRFVFILRQTNPQSNFRTIEQFLYGFINVPPGLSKRLKIEWLRRFLLLHTKNYKAIVLDMDMGEPLSIKANI